MTVQPPSGTVCTWVQAGNQETANWLCDLEQDWQRTAIAQVHGTDYACNGRGLSSCHRHRWPSEPNTLSGPFRKEFADL